MRRPAPILPGFVLAAAAVACVAAPALMLAGTHSPARVAAALVLFGVAPGAALLPWLAPRGAAAEPALLVASSFALSLLVTQLMLWVHAWSPATASCLLGGACLLSLLAQLVVGAQEGA